VAWLSWRGAAALFWEREEGKREKKQHVRIKRKGGGRYRKCEDGFKASQRERKRKIPHRRKGGSALPYFLGLGGERLTIKRVTALILRHKKNSNNNFHPSEGGVIERLQRTRKDKQKRHLHFRGIRLCHCQNLREGSSLEVVAPVSRQKEQERLLPLLGKRR